MVLNQSKKCSVILLMNKLKSVLKKAANKAEIYPIENFSWTSTVSSQSQTMFSIKRNIPNVQVILKAECWIVGLVLVKTLTNLRFKDLALTGNIKHKYLTKPTWYTQITLKFVQITKSTK